MAPASPPSAAGAAFRRLIARWATGVSVVTAREGENDFGLTVNALLSVSLSPPSLLVSLSHDADTTPVVHRTGRFGVTLLAHDQRPLSERFARMAPAAEKFDGLPLHRGPGGLALLDGGLAAFECRVVQEVESADHRLFVGVLEHAEAGRDVSPLLFFRSGYSELVAEGVLRLPAPRP